MKKFNLLFILVLSVFLVFSCSSNDDEKEELTDDNNALQDDDNSGDTLPEETANDDDKTDTVSTSDNDEKNDTVSEYDDSDTSDTGIPDNEITDSDDNSDSATEQPDNTDSTDDSGDSQHDEDDTNQTEDSDEPVDNTDSDSDTSDSDITDTTDDSDTTPETPAFPQCSPDSAKPCIDSANKLIWSSATSKNKTWAEAENHCSTLTEGGFEDWRMPTISELRTLVRNCQKTATGGACKVTDECTASYSTANPQCYNVDLCTSTTSAYGIEFCGNKTDGSYSLLGDASVYIWSSSEPDEDHDKAWFIYFKNSNILNQKKTLTAIVRCVRRDK